MYSGTENQAGFRTAGTTLSRCGTFATTPRIWGVSGLSTTWFNFFSPKLRTILFLAEGETDTAAHPFDQDCFLSLIGHSSLTSLKFFGGFTPHRRHFLRTAKLKEGVHGRLHDILGIGGSK